MKKQGAKPDQDSKISFYTRKNNARSVFVEGFANRYSEDGIKLIDRGNDLIPPDAWGDLKNFQSNGIILFNHDRNNPIGRAVKVEKRDDGLFVKAKISDSDHPEVSRIRDLVKDGVLKTFSVGFDPKRMDEEDIDGKKVNVIKEAELLEISIVSLPMAERSLFNVTAKQLADMPYDIAVKLCTGEIEVDSGVEVVDARTKATDEDEEKPDSEDDEEKPKADCEDDEDEKADDEVCPECGKPKMEDDEDQMKPGLSPDEVDEEPEKASEEISSQPKEAPTSPLLDSIKQTNILLSMLISEFKLLSQKFDTPKIVLADDGDGQTLMEDDGEDDEDDEDDEKGATKTELKLVDDMMDHCDKLLRGIGY